MRIEPLVSFVEIQSTDSNRAAAVKRFAVVETLIVSRTTKYFWRKTKITCLTSGACKYLNYQIKSVRGLAKFCYFSAKVIITCLRGELVLTNLEVV